MANRRSATTTIGCPSNLGDDYDTARTFLGLAQRAVRNQNTEWPNLASQLGLEAIRSTVDRWWDSVDSSMADASLGAKLLCLPSSMDNSDAAREVSHIWSLLSDTNRSPSPREFSDWLEVIADFMADVDHELDIRAESPPRCNSHRTPLLSPADRYVAHALG